MRAMFFAEADGMYRYWVRKVDGLSSVKLQVRRKVLAEFRKHHHTFENAVDILEIGGGWYHISARETKLDEVFGIRTDGASAWLRAFNKYHLSKVNANPPISIVYVKRINHEGMSTPPAASMFRDRYLRALTKRVQPGQNFHPRKK